MNTIAAVRRILVPTDFSDTARHATRYASELAAATGASLTVLYADSFTPPVDFTASVGGWDEHSFDRLKAEAEEQLQQEAGLDIDPRVPYDTVVRVDSAFGGILNQARESACSLIVMGTHGRTGFRRLIVGSVTEAVMRHAPVPVVAVPPHSVANAVVRTVVCPVIYNAECFAALKFAARIAPPDARFVIVRASRADGIADSADDFFELRQWVPEEIAPRCELKMFDSEHVADRIDGFARELQADLIIATERSDRTASDLLHGTFAARIVQHSDCPVLTVNAPAALATSRAASSAQRSELVGARP